MDQFSRHILRLEDAGSALRVKADELALSVAEELTSTPDWDRDLSVGEFVFSLMPFRHSATLDRLTKVLQRVDSRAEEEAKACSLLTKFRKQTLRRLQHLEDRFKVHITVSSLKSFLFISFLSGRYCGWNSRASRICGRREFHTAGTVGAGDSSLPSRLLASRAANRRGKLGWSGCYIAIRR